MMRNLKKNTHFILSCLFLLLLMNNIAYSSEFENKIVESANIENPIYFNELKRVKTSLFNWEKVWEEGDFGGYLSYYSTKFTPAKNDLNQWMKKRAQRVNPNKKIQITIDVKDISINKEADKASTTFIQHYQSKNYQDKVTKLLIWKKEKNRWLITKEKVIYP